MSLEIRNLEVEADGKKILKGVDLDVSEGEIVIITGPNGSGKSTLAKAIAGIIKPSAGKVIFDGTDLSELDVTERAQAGLAFSFQQPVKFKGIVARELLEIASGSSDDHVAEKYLKMVGLNPAEYLEREVNGSLSGGELKRVEIASVLARKARLTIFDEPEAGIDMWSFDNLIQIFQEMRRDLSGRSVVIISHQRKIMEMADRVILLKNGRIAKGDFNV